MKRLFSSASLGLVANPPATINSTLNRNYPRWASLRGDRRERGQNGRLGSAAHRSISWGCMAVTVAVLGLLGSCIIASACAHDPPSSTLTKPRR